MTSSYTSNGGHNYGLISRAGIESSLIMNRISTSLSAAGSPGVDTTLLALELKRHQRRRQMLRHGTYFEEEEKKRDEEAAKMTKAILEEREKTLAESRSRPLPSEKDMDRLANELDQWLRKMKCSGVTGTRLDSFRDVKVGVCSDPVEFKAPNVEPYPDLHSESFTFKGGKDRHGKWKGKGVIEMEDGNVIAGTFSDGMRHGECRVESSRGNLRLIIGSYERDKLNGKAKLIYEDDTWLEGYFKDGVLHGFARYFDAKGRLTFVGNHKNGKPVGVCWKVIKHGGAVVGRVDKNGELTGLRVAYIFPDYKTAFVGGFSDGILEGAQVARLKAVIEDRGVKVPMFTEPTGPNYDREISTFDKVSSNPMLRDPYESEHVDVKGSKVGGAGEGLFSKKKVEPGSVLAFYNGIKLRPKTAAKQDVCDWNINAYKIFDPSRKNGTVDIPTDLRDLSNYCATLAHKTNHSFVPNAEFVTYNHPRFGLIPCLTSTHDIEAGEEIFVHYGYELAGCPDWYEELWQKGNYPIPDSMKQDFGRDSEDELADQTEKKDQNKQVGENQNGTDEGETNGNPESNGVDGETKGNPDSNGVSEENTA